MPQRIQKFLEQMRQRQIEEEVWKMTPQEASQAIKLIYFKKMFLDGDIEKIARDNIPDYHFMRYKVSEWRTCTGESPIGVCVFELEEGKCTPDCLCRYCGEPVENK